MGFDTAGFTRRHDRILRIRLRPVGLHPVSSPSSVSTSRSPYLPFSGRFLGLALLHRPSFCDNRHPASATPLISSFPASPQGRRKCVKLSLFEDQLCFYKYTLIASFSYAPWKYASSRPRVIRIILCFRFHEFTFLVACPNPTKQPILAIHLELLTLNSTRRFE